MRISRAVALACAAVALAAPAVARAGSYQVAICHDPGTWHTAPTDAMTFPTSGAAADAGVYGGCGTAGYVYAALDGIAPHALGDLAAWRFTAPPGTQIAAAQIWRSFYAGSAFASAWPTDTLNLIASPGSFYIADSCAQTAGCTRLGSFGPPPSIPLVFSGLGGLSAIQGSAACAGGQSCPAGGSAVCPELGPDPCLAANELYAMVVTLDDASAPLVSGVGGPLTAPQVQTGAAQITFDATDTGAGLYSVSALVDGQIVREVPFDANGGSCVSLGDGDPAIARFDWAVPCVLSGSGSLTLDTAAFADGSHDVKIVVRDAAGNNAAVWSGSIITRNAPQGGTPLIAGTARVGRTLGASPGDWTPAPTAYAYQWWRCSAAGGGCAAIAGATSASYVLASADDHRRVRVAVTATGPGGSTVAASDPTPLIADAHGSTGGHRVAGGCAAASLRAALDGSAVVAYGRAVALHGTLRCGRAPIAGALVELTLAPAAGAAGTAATRVRTSADGSFSYLVGAGPSREITVRYQPSGGTSAASATLSLRVRPSVSLQVTPARTTNGHTITFTGAVSGGAEPGGGLPLDVEYLDGSRWMVYDTVLATPVSGRFTYRYTFHRTTQPITYTFRVAIPQGGVSNYPYQPAASPARSVHVDP